MKTITRPSLFFFCLLSMLSLQIIVQPVAIAQPPEENTKPETKKETPAKKQNHPIITTNQQQDATETDEEQIYLNFENAELKNFVNYIGDLKKINILPAKEMEGAKISLTIRQPISIKEAWRIFHTVIDKAGFRINKVGNLYKVVIKKDSAIEPLPAYINVPFETLPDSDKTIRYVAFFENIKVKDIEALLKSMLDPTARVIPEQNVNGFIITDKSYNIKAAMRILQELDKTGLQESVAVLQLQHADAKDVEELFKGLMGDAKPVSPLARLLGRKAESVMHYFSSSTKIFAEERRNALILLGTKDSIDKVINFIKENVDTELKAIESPLHVYELQYTDAEQIVKILKEVTAPPESPTGQAASKYGAVRGGVKYFRPMQFTADKEGNRIIVTSVDKQDWKLIKKTLHNLDKPQPQVAIEVLIVAVDTNDSKEFGGHFRNKKHGRFGNHIDFQGVPLFNTVLERENGTPGTPISLLGNLLSGVAGGLGTSLLTFGRKQNIWTIFRALQTQTHTTVLAQPFLTITNKYKVTGGESDSNIVIGETRRIISQTVTTAGEATVSGFKDTQANLELRVIPQINIDGVINLDITVKLEDFLDLEGNNQTKRTIQTKVSVADGQVLVLGGLVRTKVTENLAKTPLLGSIPILGWLFKHKEKKIEKQTVLVFMSPTIIKPRTMQGINLYTRQKLDLAKQSIDAATVTSITNDPIHDWFFNPEKKTYAHKVDDYSNARFQPVTVDIQNDTYYRDVPKRQEEKKHPIRVGKHVQTKHHTLKTHNNNVRLPRRRSRRLRKKKQTEPTSIRT